MRKLIALLALLAMAGSVAACPNVAVVRQVVVQQAAIVAQPIFVPSYTMQYNPNQAQAIQANDGLIAAIDRLAAAIAGKGGNLPADQSNLTFAVVVAGSCANCHRADNAAEKGGGFVLQEADGTIPPFSLAEKRRITDLVQKGTMPPKTAQPITDSAKKIVVDYMAKKE